MGVISNVELTLLDPDVVRFEVDITHVLFESKSAVDRDRVEFRWVRNIEKHVPGGFDMDIIPCHRNWLSFPREDIAPQSVLFFQKDSINKLWNWTFSLNATKTLDSELVSVWILSVDDEVEFSSVISWVSSIEGIFSGFK